MTNDNRRDPRLKFVPRILPWLLALLMLGVYWFTLNRWMSLYNMDFVARLSGWVWQPELASPLVFLVTYPLRWLPLSLLPVALDLFAAVCAAATLGLLARTVALLPQDRTEAQRMREHSNFSCLTTRFAWLPPVFAVLVCGLQYTFWLHATNFTGESLDLLVFAFVIWSLAEYRLDESDGRLMAAVFLYGLDMTENFAMIGFLPVLVAALIWLRGVSFFNLRFLTRLLVCGFAGTLLYFLLPTVAVASGGATTLGWWHALKANLSSQSHAIKFFLGNGDVRYNLYLISLTTLLPVFLMGLRWKATFGDRSKLGMTVTNWMVHAMCAVMLGVCVWGAFDPPFAARHLGAGSPFLTFYYMAALSVGYFSGYFLLVFKPVPARPSRRRQPMQEWLKALHWAVVAGVTVFAALAAAGLICKNGPAITFINSGILRTYAGFMAAKLPPSGGIVFSDSDSGVSDVPRRLFLLEEELAQEHRQNQYVPVDTLALNLPVYHRYLHKKFGDKWPLVVGGTNNNMLDPHGLLALVRLLAKTNDLYYLHPSFGYYFEAFYQEPHGLVYRLKNLPDETLRPPRADAALIAENEDFWKRAEAEAFGPVFRENDARESFHHSSDRLHQIWKRLHVEPEPNPNALLAGAYFSRDLDFWGVAAQRARQLPQAAAHFETAIKLNPDNTVAAINLQFNHALQAGRQPPIDISQTTPDYYGKYGTWQELVTVNGPLDDASFTLQDGNIYMQGNLVNQAIEAFERVRELQPDYLPVLLGLGQVYVLIHRPAAALDALREPLLHPDRFSLNEMNSTKLNVIAAAAFIQNTNLDRGIQLLQKEVDRHPDDDQLLTLAAQVYSSHHLYTNALQVIRARLATAPNNPSWLFGLGYVCLEMKDYPAAIAALSKVISLNPENNDARFNRALACLGADQLDAARADYEQLQKNFPKSYPVAYGLGEISWRQRNTNDAVKNYTIYLANAPTNTAEFKSISQRLADLKGGAR